MILVTRPEFLKTSGRWNDTYSVIFRDVYELIDWASSGYRDNPGVATTSAFPALELEDRWVDFLRSHGYSVFTGR